VSELRLEEKGRAGASCSGGERARGRTCLLPRQRRGAALTPGQGHSEKEACCGGDGMGGKVSGACKRGTHGRAVLAGTAQRAAPGLAPLALP